jgi:hypothetical protein
MSQAVFDACIGRSRVRGVGKQGVAAAQTVFARLELWREIKFCVGVFLTFWALPKEEVVAKFVAYYVIEATTSAATVAELAAHRQRAFEFLGADERPATEIIGRRSGRGRHLQLRDAVREARARKAKLLIVGSLPEGGFQRLTDQVSICVVDVPALNRSELREFLLQRPEEKPKGTERSNRSTATKVGLQKAKSRGAILGNPSARSLQPKASHAASAAAEEFRAKLRIRILEDHRDGLSLRAIASKLNSDGVPTARGRSWHAPSVRKILTEAKEGWK